MTKRSHTRPPKGAAIVQAPNHCPETHLLVEYTLPVAAAAAAGQLRGTQHLPSNRVITTSRRRRAAINQRRRESITLFVKSDHRPLQLC
jgi:hypothetical protein